jgi:hypothetical protein
VLQFPPAEPGIPGHTGTAWLFGERNRIDGEVIRFPSRQRQVHSGVRIEYCSSYRWRIKAGFLAIVERCGIGNLQGLVRRDNMTGAATLLRQPLSVGRFGRRSAVGNKNNAAA